MKCIGLFAMCQKYKSSADNFLCQQKGYTTNFLKLKLNVFHINQYKYM